MTRQRPDGDMEFRFFRRAASAVYLAGDFNGWNPSATSMQMTDDGWWHCRLQLQPGLHRFKYVADGYWYLDYGAFGVERGPLGEWNSTVWVDRHHDHDSDAEPTATLSIEFSRPDRDTECSLVTASGSAA
jgi:1,4-alpha-glucan branching enzyme